MSALLVPCGQGCRRPAAAAALAPRAVALALGLAASVGPGVPRAQGLDYAAGLAVTYDDNILDYSDRDLFAFRYRLNPPRFGIKSTDDFVTVSYLEVAWAPDPGRATALLARLEAEGYATNGIRNNVAGSMQYRARPFDRWRVSVGAGLVPSYYKRRYIDYDTTVPYPALPRYRDARYRQADGTAAAEWRPPGRWRAQLAYTFARRDFLDAFPERDQDRHLVRLTILLPHSPTFETRLRGTYERVLARGPQGDAGSGRPDVSAASLGTSLSFAWSPRLQHRPLTLQQAVGFEDRRYTTRDATDASRFGRSIHELDLGWELAWTISRRWRVAAGYTRTLERLTGDLTGVETFTDAGSYDRDRVSARLDWSSR